ncbi:hypothetical protein BD324DRAFT_578355 [Kockovaella imperatae]|uniref:Alpha/Beta hydrolase protein n=1 Tax=Kockovaella imperatae TaxID=4999 RepID=A0A1Y1UIS6_9TREE|nr:hypothetical protein BD324DRAFT_578355 [Kockovaella imperatae]ORX37879.1 hypothetical protein BD324DRAFT_578355 [Kockovaella imperatae]
MLTVNDTLPRDHDDFSIDKLWKNDPLPEEIYPRVIEKHIPERGYYIALGLIMSIWMITPLSCAYLIWFVLLGQGLRGGLGLTSTLFAAYALTEVVFAIYTSYLVRWVQTPTPASVLPLEARNELFRRVLTSDLGYSVPERPAESDDPEKQMDMELWNLYRSGHLSEARYHHAKDRKYEMIHGIQAPGPRVGKMSEGQKDLIGSFVEDHPGEREQRLRDQVEKDVGFGQDDFDDGIMDKHGKLIHLHPMDRRAVEFRERLRTWFNHAPWESLRRQNVIIWLSWSCFNLPYEDVQNNKKWLDFLDASLKMLEARTGTRFPDGFDPNVEMLRLTLDPVNAKGRPLILYAVTNTINWFLREIVYPYQGMGLYREGGIDYLIRIPAHWTPEKGRTEPNAMPIIYFHGLGFGLLQNHLLIKHLLESLPTHPICVPLAVHTSQSIFHERHLRPWTRRELVPAIKNICKKWGFWEQGVEEWGVRKDRSAGGVSLMSHSNGSTAHGWILKDCPELSRRNTFVDPVVFCLWEGGDVDICHSFCYRKPSTALELLLYYFIASEVGIANYIQRHFDWADNNLWFDEIPNVTDPRKTAFFLGGKDIIIDTARARKYLERHGAGKCIYWASQAGHGDGLSGESRDRVVMFVGTGSTRGWQGWLTRGRRTHSLGRDDWQRLKRNLKASSTAAASGSSDDDEPLRRGSEMSSASMESDATRVEDVVVK